MSTYATVDGPDDYGRPEATCRSLTRAQQDLIALFHQIRFGRIHRLRVQDGQPDLKAGAPWTQTVKILGENAPHPCKQAKDFTLRREVVQFFRLLKSLGDGEITDLQIRDGLPCSYEVSGTHSP